MTDFTREGVSFRMRSMARRLSLSIAEMVTWVSCFRTTDTSSRASVQSGSSQLFSSSAWKVVSLRSLFIYLPPHAKTGWMGCPSIAMCPIPVYPVLWPELMESMCIYVVDAPYKGEILVHLASEHNQLKFDNCIWRCFT